MKKKLKGLIVIVVVIVVAYLIGSGIRKNPNIKVVDYKVSTDGKTITLVTEPAVANSYARAVFDHPKDTGKHYVDFYYPFGGKDSSLGAKNEFKIKVKPTDNEIYIVRKNLKYELALVKNDSGEWSLAQNN